MAIPEIPEWRALQLAPLVAAPSISAGLEALDAASLARGQATATEPREAGPGRAGVVGFSFGAPHALAAAAEPGIGHRIDRVVSFGGYADLRSAARYLFTGDDGSGEAAPAPDPYGRWVVAANCLSLLPEGGSGDVAAALLTLAAEAGDRGEPSWSPIYEPSRKRLREGLPARRRGLFDLIAPPSGAELDIRKGGELADRLVTAALEASPELEPLDALARVRQRVHILHGTADRLMRPIQAGLLRDALGARSRLTITRLFAHSEQEGWPGPIATLREAGKFVKALAEVLGAGKD